MLVALLFFAPNAVRADDSDSSNKIRWESWSKQVFERARAEHKPVILDLEAVWCHWCHVMDATTYADPAVVILINQHFVALKVDQDSRPDLSLRYQNYGWPATIIFSPNGTEIVKQAGYLKPAEMRSLLTDDVRKPNSVQFEKKSKVMFNGKASLFVSQRKELVDKFLFGYDRANGGWGSGHKFLDWDTVEFCLTNVERSSSDDKGDLKITAKKPDYLTMAESTLRGEQCLIDPVWGGVYQYSTDGEWVHPHFGEDHANASREYAYFCIRWFVVEQRILFEERQ